MQLEELDSKFITRRILWRLNSTDLQGWAKLIKIARKQARGRLQLITDVYLTFPKHKIKDIPNIDIRHKGE